MNVYYDPEKFGLTIIDSWDFSDGSYQFDYRVIWKNTKGELLTARDSGCSCPSPFEDTALTDLVSVSLTDLKQEAIDAAKESYYSGDPLSDILEKIRKLEGVTHAA